MKLKELREIYAKTENGSGIKMEVYSVMHNHFPAMLDLVEACNRLKEEVVHLEITSGKETNTEILEILERIEKVGE